MSVYFFNSQIDKTIFLLNLLVILTKTYELKINNRKGAPMDIVMTLELAGPLFKWCPLRFGLVLIQTQQQWIMNASSFGSTLGGAKPSDAGWPAAAPLDSGTFFLLHPLPSSRIHRSDQATSAGRSISLSSDMGYALISNFTTPPARKWLSCSENTLD